MLRLLQQLLLLLMLGTLTLIRGSTARVIDYVDEQPPLYDDDDDDDFARWIMSRFARERDIEVLMARRTPQQFELRSV